MPRGGRRSGTPGASYSNRSDLAQAPRAATGQTYGDRKAQLDAQRAVPVAAPVLPQAPAATGQGASPSSGPLPGSLGFTDETQRPNEPITAGMAMGPGAGPEALTLMQDTSVQDILPWLPALEMMASQPGSSQQTRQLVRRIRSLGG